MTMDTVLEIIKKLQDKGYHIDYNKSPNLKKLEKTPQLFKVDEIFRYEGLTDPEDETIVYAISSVINNQKGILVNGYGIYALPEVEEIINKLNAS